MDPLSSRNETRIQMSDSGFNIKNFLHGTLLAIDGRT